jgi:glycosyltransferase involved in cell wall biosynthesis
MKILHLTKKYPDAIGGDSSVVYNLEKQLNKNGHKITILTSNCDEIKNKKNLIKFGIKDKSENLDKITLKRVLSLMYLFLKSFEILKQEKPDIVHSHSIDLGFVVSFACNVYKIPIINTCHGVSFNDSQFSIFKRKLELFFLKNGRFNKIITVDQNSLRNFKEKGINNAIYVPNGIDLNEFKEKKMLKKDRKLSLIFIGRLEKQKGVNYLIESIKILKNVDLKLTIIGKGSEENKLKNIVKSYGLDNKIVFFGNKTNKEVEKELFNSDIFILPSIWEGFPLTILEAWGAKLPVIVTNVGGISAVCKNNENALVIPSKDSNKIAIAITALINNKDLRKKLRVNGNYLVNSVYSWEIITKRFEYIYKEITK